LEHRHLEGCRVEVHLAYPHEGQGWSKRSPGLVTGSDHDQAHAARSQSSRKLESEAELKALVCPA